MPDMHIIHGFFKNCNRLSAFAKTKNPCTKVQGFYPIFVIQLLFSCCHYDDFSFRDAFTIAAASRRNLRGGLSPFCFFIQYNICHLIHHRHLPFADVIHYVCESTLNHWTHLFNVMIQEPPDLFHW